jgi:hypothetical protein
VAAEVYGHRGIILTPRLRQIAPITQPVRQAVRVIIAQVIQAEDRQATVPETVLPVAHPTARLHTAHRATALRHQAEAIVAGDAHRHPVLPDLQAVALHQEAVAEDALHPVEEDNNTEYITG